MQAYETPTMIEMEAIPKLEPQSTLSACFVEGLKASNLRLNIGNQTQKLSQIEIGLIKFKIGT
jgi:hypothetical protein